MLCTYLFKPPSIYADIVQSLTNGQCDITPMANLPSKSTATDPWLVLISYPTGDRRLSRLGTPSKHRV